MRERTMLNADPLPTFLLHGPASVGLSDRRDEEQRPCGLCVAHEATTTGPS
jgi:hypothetical protein